MNNGWLRARIRTIPDWPEPGVQFRDITPVLQDPQSFRVLIDCFVERFMNDNIDVVAGIDARGFIIGSVIAYELNRGFVPIRKKGKLPFETVAPEYSLEYGSATLEMHTDAILPGQRVLLVDDLVATGGTLLAATQLVTRLGGELVSVAAVIDLPGLGGSARVRELGVPLFTLCDY